MELKETKGTQGTQGTQGYLESQITNMYSDLIFKRTYARTQGESWDDAVERYETYFIPRVPEKLKDDFKRAIELFKEKELVGSMRALATAGGPLELYPEALYNCSYLNFESYRDFADMLMLLMLGVGVGYSIEPRAISGLPKRPKRVLKSDIKITVADSKEGWRDSFLALLELLNEGLIPDIDYSEIRPAGTPLKTFGGTASGPEPLKFLFEQAIRLFEVGAGKPWSPEEVFDLANSIAYAVISGGVRRSACIALAESKDALKLKPKDFWSVKPWRSYSNISVTDMNNLGISRYIKYLRENGTGEPGIFNREKAQERLKEVGREPEEGLLGVNPCLTKGALILTSEGERPIGELAKLESFEIVNKDGKITKGTAWFTGVKDVYQVKSGSKVLLEATPDHKVMTNTGEVVEVKDLVGKHIKVFDSNLESPLVTSVEYKGKEPVYDFSEPVTHFGVVNGFIVHNCGEVLLRPFQFCNLTEVNVKPGDTLDFLKEKVKAATLLGALQSQNYPENLFNPKWLENAKKEPLLGVSLTGLRTHEILGETSEQAKSWLQELRKEAREYSELLGNIMGLNFTAVTTVKPSGTTSQILGTTSGLHPSFSKYFLRRLRIHKHDPLVETLRKAPVHFEEDSGNSETLVMEFPLSAPNHKDRDLIDQLEYYKMFSRYWTDHNPSCTITVKDNEWGLLGQWLQENLQDVIGITFLPEVSDYPQAPYEKLTEEEYYKRLKEWEGYFAYSKGNFEKLKIELFANLESLTNRSNEVTFACSGGTCEIDTL